MKIFYGTVTNYIEITDICSKSECYYIPHGDENRSKLFSDPCVGHKKSIIIQNNDKNILFDELIDIYINFKNMNIVTNFLNTSLSFIHSKLKIKYGSFNEEIPEQKMAIQYLTGDEKVLEIGSNIGRNTLIIAFILKNSNNLVSLESNYDIYKQLEENKNLNNMNFNIENSALSTKKLIQKGWDTVQSDVLLDGYEHVNIVSFEFLQNKYNINFDTLVLDCEGAFYYILQDFPELLDNIKLIIMENDYKEILHKNYVDEQLIKNDFKRVFVEQGGWGHFFNNFFEVWKK
jgi:FkbM family methyltransferase